MRRYALNACALSMILVAALTGCAGLAGTKTDSPSDMPLVFSDDFEKGSGNWAPTDPAAWEILEDGGSKVFALTGKSKYTPPVRSPHNIALVKGLNVTDFVIEARMKQTGKDYGHRDMCIFFGHNDPAHFYYVHIATKADAHANSIFLVNNEPRVSIASERTKGTDWGRDVWHTVRVKRDTQSGSIEVYFDDMETPIMKAVDKTFLTGTIGFGSFDDTGNVDDVRIWGRN